MALKPRSDKLIIAAIGLVLLAAGAVYYVLGHARELKLNLETDRIVLGVLVIIMSLLVVALLVLLLRNLIKLLVERRHQVLGSRFRTKLVFIFLILVLIPSLALFWAAVNLILDVNENLFVDPLEQITADSKKIVDAYNRLERTDCARFADAFAGQITEYRMLDPARERMLQTRAADFARAGGLDFIEVYGAGSREPVFSWRRRSSDKPPLPPAGIESGAPAQSLRQSGLDAVRGRETTHRLDRLDPDGTWQRVSAAAPVRSGSPFDGVAGAVVVGRYISPELGARTAAIDREFREYRNSLKDRPEPQAHLHPALRHPDPARDLRRDVDGVLSIAPDHAFRSRLWPKAPGRSRRQPRLPRYGRRRATRSGSSSSRSTDDPGAALQPPGDRYVPQRAPGVLPVSWRNGRATSSSSSRTCPPQSFRWTSAGGSPP